MNLIALSSVDQISDLGLKVTNSCLVMEQTHRGDLTKSHRLCKDNNDVQTS